MLGALGYSFFSMMISGVVFVLVVVVSFCMDSSLRLLLDIDVVCSLWLLGKSISLSSLNILVNFVYFSFSSTDLASSVFI